MRIVVVGLVDISFDPKVMYNVAHISLNHNAACPLSYGHHFLLNGDTCAICLEEFVASDVSKERSKVFKAKCGHVFHASCVMTWLRKKHTCPLCREQVLPGVPCTGASDVEESSAINLAL